MSETPQLLPPPPKRRRPRWVTRILLVLIALVVILAVSAVWRQVTRDNDDQHGDCMTRDGSFTECP